MKFSTKQRYQRFHHALAPLSVLISLSALLVAGCAHSPSSDDGDRADAGDVGPIKKRYSIEGAVVNGVKLEVTDFDYPVTINSRVEYWVDYFTGRGRGHFERYLERAELFVPYITPILRQNGMPEDLVYLAMIESGFNNHARSTAKAVGPWQFISATGKRYGMSVNWWVDERRDTRKSTLAAVAYLGDLYSIFHSWELAAASYNAGESKVARAIRRFGTKDFWALTRHRFLRPETRNYVPKIIAAAIVSKNRHLFGFRPANLNPSEGEALAPDGSIVRVETQADPLPKGTTRSQHLQDMLASEEIEEMEALGDPALISESASEDGQVSIPNRFASILEGPLAKAVATPKVDRKGGVTGEILAEFEVQSPADLLKIARASGLSYHTVKALNPELLRWCTPPTSKSYRVKLPVSVKDKFLATYNHDAFPREIKFMVAKVNGGETLSRIARRYGIKVDPIRDLNRMSPDSPLRKGATVLLPMPNDRSRTIASLEIIDPPERRRRAHKRYRGSSGKRYYKVSFKRRQAAKTDPKAAPKI